MSRVDQNGIELKSLLDRLNHAGKKIAGLGASTKGNVLLQYYGISTNDINVIGEVNSDKFGSFTPGTKIPIISEDKLIEDGFEYFLVLPWHFKNFFLSLEKLKGKKLIFPLPKVHVIQV